METIALISRPATETKEFSATRKKESHEKTQYYSLWTASDLSSRRCGGATGKPYYGTHKDSQRHSQPAHEHSGTNGLLQCSSISARKFRSISAKRRKSSFPHLHSRISGTSRTSLAEDTRDVAEIPKAAVWDVAEDIDATLWPTVSCADTTTIKSMNAKGSLHWRRKSSKFKLSDFANCASRLVILLKNASDSRTHTADASSVVNLMIIIQQSVQKESTVNKDKPSTKMKRWEESFYLEKTLDIILNLRIPKKCLNSFGNQA